MNISETVDRYISVTYLPAKQKDIYKALDLLEEGEHQFYEDRYDALIIKSDGLDNDSKSDIFLSYIEEDLIELIRNQGVELNTESGVMLETLIQIVELLQLVFKIEEETYPRMIVDMYCSDKQKFTTMATYYKPTHHVAILDAVKSVSEDLFDRIRMSLTEKQSDLVEECQPEHISTLKTFLTYLQDVPHILTNKPVLDLTNVPIEQMDALLTLDLKNHIQNHFPSKPEQATLDILVLLMANHETYSEPVKAFGEKASLFTDVLEQVTKIDSLLRVMVSDFEEHCKLLKLAETYHAN